MIRLYFFAIISVLIFASNAINAQTLIINEVSNGPGGNQEYVEFIVVDDAITYDCASPVPPCIDIRGWIFDDNSGYHGSVGVAAGCVRFANDPLWACVPVGTVIVIYNNADPNVSLPANDVSMIDGNCTIVAPINSSLFESNSTTPGAVACSYPATGWTPGGNWNNTIFANSGDCARIVDLSGCEVFSLCWGTADQNNQIYFAGSGQDDVWSFTGADPYNQADWTQGCAGDVAACGSNDQTPGAPNNADNAAYIGQFNNNCTPITPIVAAVVLDTDATCGCDGQATASGSGSIPGYTYEWLDENLLPIGQTSATATGLCPGTYYSIVTSSIGCSDTSSATVISNGSVTVTVNSVTICNGSSATLTATPSVSGGTYLWTPGGSTSPFITVSPSSTTVYTVEYSQGGCLASASGTITVNPVYNLTENATVCQGDSYTFPDGTSQVITADLSYTSNLTTTQECDSIIVTSITVNPVYNLTENITLCEGSSYTYPDGTVSNNIAANESHISNLLTAAGCDSVVTTFITINSIISTSANIALCSGSSYTFADGTTQNNITANLSYTSSFVSVQGCDSLHTENISINPVFNLTENATVCQGDSYTFPDGTSQLITADLSYTSNLTTTQGCDSIIVINVVVNPIYNLTQSDAVCQGDSYTFPDGSSQVITADLSYTSNLTTTQECDSIIVTSITVNPVYNLTENITLCEGSSYTYPDGTVSNNIAANESHISNLLTAAGCDSVVTTFIEILDASVHAGEDQVICEGQSVTLSATGAVNYIWSNSVQNDVPFVPAVSGTYTVSGTDINGCIAEDEVFVYVETIPEINLVIEQDGNCAPTTVIFTNPSENDVSYVWYLSNGVTLTGNPVSYTFQQGGNYGVSVTAISTTGCNSTFEANNLISIGSGTVADFTVNPNEITTLNPTVQLFNSSSNASEYLWIFPDGSTTNEQNPNYIFQEDQTGSYEIMLVTNNEFGCVDTAIQFVNVQEELLFYVPNSFTPDGDIYNQTFKPVFTSGFDPFDYTLYIFNRWGEIVFESHNSEIGWDGSYSGVNGSDVYQCQDGTYTWKIIFKVSWSDERKVAVGHVNLLR